MNRLMMEHWPLEELERRPVECVQELIQHVQREDALAVSAMCGNRLIGDYGAWREAASRFVQNWDAGAREFARQFSRAVDNPAEMAELVRTLQNAVDATPLWRTSPALILGELSH